LNSSGIEQRKQSQIDRGGESKTGYGKAGKQTTLSNFPTATTTTNYNQLWDTDSEGKVNLLPFIAHIVEHCCVGITVVHQQPLKFHRGNIANCTALIMLCGFRDASWMFV
jgi:hypothetical protein